MVRTSLVVLAVALGALVVVYRADAQVQRTAAYRTTAKPTITGSHAQRSHANARRSSGRGPGSGVYGSSGGAGLDHAGVRIDDVLSIAFAHGRKVASHPVKGLIAAGGEATRLGELTRVANKHLLPVGRWPMIYYPLQLLQLAGVREVLIVTAQGHAGQLIDLLGDGRLEARGTDEPLFDVDLTYKVQTRAGGIAQVVGMARDFAGGGPLVVVLGDNIFERAHAAEIRAWADR